MWQKPDFTMRQQNKKQYVIKPNAKLKNKFNSEIITGDIINEEEIEGKYYFVVRNEKRNIVKLTKEAYTVIK